MENKTSIKIVEHSPLPWTFEESRTNGEPDGKDLFLVSENEPQDTTIFLLKKAGKGGLKQARVDAAFIVKACNAYEKEQALKEELVELIKEAVTFAGEYEADFILRSQDVLIKTERR